MTSKNLLPLVVVLALLVAGALGYYLYASNQNSTNPTPNSELPSRLNVAVEPTAPIPPTRTPEEIKIIAQVKDYQVEITKDGFVPASLEINAFDQVFFLNQDSVMHKVKGDNWGGVPVGPKEKFIQTFEKPGTFNYSDPENPSLKGVIIVK